MPPEWLVKVAAIAGGLTGPIALLLTMLFRRADRPRLIFDIRQKRLQTQRGSLVRYNPLGVRFPAAMLTIAVLNGGGRTTTIRCQRGHAKLRDYPNPLSLKLGYLRDDHKARDVKLPGGESEDVLLAVEVPPECVGTGKPLHLKVAVEHTCGRAGFPVEVFNPESA